MKRLLAYLFIVLGLGLTFNVNADAASKINVKSKSNYTIVIEAFEPTNWKEQKNNKIEFSQIKLIAIKHCNNNDVSWDLLHNYGRNFNGKSYKSWIKSITYNFKCKKNSPIKIVTKSYDSNKDSQSASSKSTFICEKYKNKWKKEVYDYCKWFDYTKSKFYYGNSEAKYVSRINGQIVLEQDWVRYNESEAFNKVKDYTEELYNEFKIAKVEPSQNKEVSKLVLICEAKYKGKKGYRVFKTTSQILSEALPIINSKKCFAILEENKNLFSQANKFSVPNFTAPDDFLRVANDVSRNFYDTHPKLAELTKSSKFSFDGSYVSFKNKFRNTQIAKAEPSQTQKIVDDELFANSKINNLDKINVNQYENGFGVYLNENDRLVFNIKKKEARIEYNLNKKNPHIFRIIEINDEYIKMEQTYVNFKYAYNDGSCNSRCWKKFEKRKNESGEFATYLSMTFSLKDGKLNKIYYPSSQKPEIENKNILSKIKNIIAKPFVYTKDFFLEIKDNKIVSKFKDNKTAEYLSENKKELIEIIFWAAITYYALDEGFGKDLFKSNSSSSTSSLVKPKIGSDLSKGGYHYTYNGSATLLRTLKSLRVYGF
jgi:hypothetical protein